MKALQLLPESVEVASGPVRFRTTKGNLWQRGLFHRADRRFDVGVEKEDGEVEFDLTVFSWVLLQVVNGIDNNAVGSATRHGSYDDGIERVGVLRFESQHLSPRGRRAERHGPSIDAGHAGDDVMGENKDIAGGVRRGAYLLRHLTQAWKLLH